MFSYFSHANTILLVFRKLISNDNIKAVQFAARKPRKIYEKSIRFSCRPRPTAARRPALKGRFSRTAGRRLAEISQKGQSLAASLSLYSACASGQSRIPVGIQAFFHRRRSSLKATIRNTSFSAVEVVLPALSIL